MSKSCEFFEEQNVKIFLNIEETSINHEISLNKHTNTIRDLYDIVFETYNDLNPAEYIFLIKNNYLPKDENCKIKNFISRLEDETISIENYGVGYNINFWSNGTLVYNPNITQVKSAIESKRMKYIEHLGNNCYFYILKRENVNRDDVDTIDSFDLGLKHIYADIDDHCPHNPAKNTLISDLEYIKNDVVLELEQRFVSSETCFNLYYGIHDIEYIKEMDFDDSKYMVKENKFINGNVGIYYLDKVIYLDGMTPKTTIRKIKEILVDKYSNIVRSSSSCFSFEDFTILNYNDVINLTINNCDNNNFNNNNN
eukprot:TRINITY_DN2733_c0_g1_i2.p1 TRINITY_DN2733_c0_g1~~TRINITY_DN2733_c0_g1_i2.p1  ORF type:complete len:311 (-),score=38.03 TRINITY_DN2733_c0_g1_i2:1099-2031(-)